MEPLGTSWTLPWILRFALISSPASDECGHRKISPQFHVIFDDTFQTVNSLPLNQPLDKQWAQIF